LRISSQGLKIYVDITWLDGVKVKEPSVIGMKISSGLVKKRRWRIFMLGQWSRWHGWPRMLMTIAHHIENDEMGVGCLQASLTWS